MITTLSIFIGTIVVGSVVALMMWATTHWLLAQPAPDDFEDEVDTGEWEAIGTAESGMLENWHKPERGWMQTASGRRFYPLEPCVEDVELVDVAHGLAFTCRYGGHTKRFYSVAEHCVLVSEVVERDAQRSGMPADFVRALALEALLHDSAEAYIGDMVRPLKHQTEMIGFRNAEARIEECIRAAFKIESTEQSHKVIKIVDDRILVDEIEALMPNPQMYLETDTMRGVEPIGVFITGWSPELAQHRFMERYRELVA